MSLLMRDTYLSKNIKENNPWNHITNREVLLFGEWAFVGIADWFSLMGYSLEGKRVRKLQLWGITE